MSDRIGNCRIVGEIGSGGMAVVYKAVQEPLGVVLGPMWMVLGRKVV